MLVHFKIWIRNDPVSYFEEVSWVHLVFCFALVSRRRFITSLKGALLFLFIRSKVDRSLRVICKHKTLNQANVGAGRLISPKYTLPFPAACYIYLFFYRFQLIQNKEFRETPCDLDKLNWNLLFAPGSLWWGHKLITCVALCVVTQIERGWVLSLSLSRRWVLYSNWGFTFKGVGPVGTLLKRGALNGRPILTHGVSTSWTNKINGQRRPPLKLTPPRPSDAKQKPHDTIKFQGMDTVRVH